ncbi:YMGG-like glycine zipper-containing protein [Novispirillum sp. DQ9]|uniref:YMGG-like glycine zipper-containing protein n=1 Tax=Novispirillum sp. DQ9 TaxID=3398612 RepID=UPI003C7CD223
MKTLAIATTALAAALALSACGETKADRAISGAALGAGGGAVIGALTVGAPVQGAAIGGALGAAAGALTDTDQINLGKPFWK